MKKGLVLGLFCLMMMVHNLWAQPFSPDENTLFLCHFDKTIAPDYAKGNKEFLKKSSAKLTREGKFGSALFASRKPSIDIFDPTDYLQKKPFLGINYFSEGNIDSKMGTIEMWVKPYFSLGAPDKIHVYYLFSTKTDEGGKFIIALITGAEKQGVVFSISDPGENLKEYGRVDWKVGLTTEKWHHIAFTWDEKELSIWFDNEKRGSRSRPASFPVGKTFAIGGSGYKARGITDGLIDEFRISNIIRYSQKREEARERLKNSGFEKKLDGWKVMKEKSAEGNWKVKSTFAKSGKYSLFFSKTNGFGSLRLSPTETIPVKPGVEYRLRAYYHVKKIPDFSIYGCRAFLEVNGHTKDDKKKFIVRTSTRQSVPVLSKPGQWVPRVLWFRPKDDIKKVQVSFVVEGNPSEIWLDNLSLSVYDPKEDQRPFSLSPPELKLSWEETLKVLASRKEVTGELKQIAGIPRLCLNEKTVVPLFYRMRGKRKHGYCKDFNEAGVKMQMVIVPVGGTYVEVWKGPGEYDFEPIDTRIKFALKGNPDGYIVVAMALGPYSGWEEKHLDEVCRDQDGLMAMGRYEREYFDKERRKKGDHGIYSYYSETLRAEVNEMIVAVMNFLKEQPYYKSIVGFSLSGGHDGQWRTSQQPNHLIDYSPGAVKAFRNFMKEKYGTEKNMQCALKQNSITFNTLAPPSKESRTSNVFRDPQKDRLLVDYSEFLSVKKAQLVISFARTIKENAGKPIFVTTYYTDLIKGTQNHLNAAREMHNSSYIDMIHGPTEYNPWRQPGGPGSTHSCLGSLRLHNMLWLQELDLRTWISPRYNPKAAIEHAWAKDIDEFKAISQREIGTMIAKQAGAYYYDMTGGYFHDKSIMENVAQCYQVYKSIILKKDNFVPDVAVIVDEESCYWISEDYGVMGAVNLCLPFMHDSLYVSGVPFDIYQLDDLIRFPVLRDYKIYIFLNSFFISQNERDFINRNLKKDGKTLVWMYAPGYISDEEKSVENISKLTGIKVKTLKGEKTRFMVKRINIESPLTKGLPPILGGGNIQKFWIEDDEVIPFAVYVEGKEIAGAMKQLSDWRSVYFAAPVELPPALINNIASLAKAYICTGSGIPIWVNDNFISVHGTKGGLRQITLPRYCKRVKNAFTGKTIARNTGKIKINVPLHKTLWFILE